MEKPLGVGGCKRFLGWGVGWPAWLTLVMASHGGLCWWWLGFELLSQSYHWLQPLAERAAIVWTQGTQVYVLQRCHEPGDVDQVADGCRSAFGICPLSCVWQVQPASRLGLS